MRYEIDQSGKIEQTHLNTVLAVSNGKKRTVFLTKKEKRLLQRLFRAQGKRSGFVYEVFSVLVSLLIFQAEPEKKVILDNEYLGHEGAIKARILEILKTLGYQREVVIYFGFVGKQSPAHRLAVKTARGEMKPTKKVKLEEVVKLIWKEK